MRFAPQTTPPPVPDFGSGVRGTIIFTISLRRLVYNAG
jgi:hypothetical protein